MKNAKKFAALFLAAAIFALSFCSCSQKKEALEIASANITQSSENPQIEIKLKNISAESLKNLSVKIEIDGEISVMEYPVALEEDSQATFKKNIEKNYKKATLLSASYQKDGESLTQSFRREIKKESAQTQTSGAATRAQLAESMIADIKKQFRSQGYNAEGNYDEENKQLLMAAYFTKSYSECRSLYNSNPEQWDELCRNMENMSLKVEKEFDNNGFTDVNVVLGMMSSDEKLIISVTNGTTAEFFPE